MNDWLLLASYAVCAFSAAFFAGAETALTSVSDSTIFRLKQEGRRGAERLERLRENLGKTLGTILVGSTVANIAAGSLGTALAISLWGERWGVLVATIATTLLLLVFAEVTPKTLAARRAEEFALVVSRPVEILVRLLSPATSVLSRLAAILLQPLGAGEEEADSVTEADVKSLITLSHEQGGLEREETEFLHNVLDFGDTPVKEAMISRSKMVALPANADFPTVESICREHRYSRYPVYRGTQDEIIGILHLKDLFDVTDEAEKTFELARHLRPAVFVPELKRAGDLFREMRRRRFHMAIVVDELGAVSGLVTLEDLVEEIVGDISDEHDDPEKRPVNDGTSLLLEGTYPLASLERELGVSFDEPEVETVAGFLIRKFGRIPRAGSRARERDLEFIVERASLRAIERIRIVRKPLPVEDEKRKAS